MALQRELPRFISHSDARNTYLAWYGSSVCQTLADVTLMLFLSSALSLKWQPSTLSHSRTPCHVFPCRQLLLQALRNRDRFHALIAQQCARSLAVNPVVLRLSAFSAVTHCILRPSCFHGWPALLYDWLSFVAVVNASHCIVLQHLQLLAVVKGVRAKDVDDEAARMVSLKSRMDKW